MRLLSLRGGGIASAAKKRQHSRRKREREDQERGGTGSEEDNVSENARRKKSRADPDQDGLHEVKAVVRKAKAGKVSHDAAVENALHGSLTDRLELIVSQGGGAKEQKMTKMQV
jgi:hypothetical protein